MPKYMSGVSFYDKFIDAEQRYQELTNVNNIVLEKHKDGSGAIVRLNDKPVQVGQCPYQGSPVVQNV